MSWKVDEQDQGVTTADNLTLSDHNKVANAFFKMISHANNLNCNLIKDVSDFSF